MTIFSVYIEEGCITCDACEEAAPEVFEVTDDTCFIKSDVRLDGGFDRNDSKSGLASLDFFLTDLAKFLFFHVFPRTRFI